MALIYSKNPTLADPPISHAQSGAIWGWGSPSDPDSFSSINLNSANGDGLVYVTFYHASGSGLSRVGSIDSTNNMIDASAGSAGAGGVSADSSPGAENVFYEVRAIAADVTTSGAASSPALLLTANATATGSITVPAGYNWISSVLWGCSATADFMGSGTSADLQLFVQRGRTCQYLPGGGFHSAYDFDGIEVIAAATQAGSMASVALGKYVPNMSMVSGAMAYGVTRGSALLWLNVTTTNATDSDFQVYYAPSGTISGTAIEAGGLEPPSRLFMYGGMGTGANMTKQHCAGLAVPLTSFKVGSAIGTLDTVIAYCWNTARAGQTGSVSIKSWDLPR